MSNPIVFTITDAGLNAALDAENNGLTLNLDKVKVGTGKYTPSAATTAMTGVWGTFDIAAGDIETASKTLRLSTVVSSATKQDVFEIGIFTDTNILFAVASITGSEPFFTVFPNIDFIGSFGLTLGQIDSASITVTIDQNAALALSIFNQHVTTDNPHPQYTKNTEFNAHKDQNTLEHNNLVTLIGAETTARSNADTAHLNAADPHSQYPLKTALANAIWHVDSWHGTNSTSYNPATALAPFFGYETTWYLWPYVPAGVANTSAALGQITGLGDGSLLAATTRIWQRLPDGASPPSYSLTASQTTVDEGQQVTFTLTTTGIAQGTQVAWNITGIQSADISPNALTGQFVVGADGTATYTLTIIEDTVGDETETLKFALTYIANKFVNVVISDTTLVEQVVTISSDQADINLLQLFTNQYGAPINKTRAVFEVEAGVNIIASSTLIHAVYSDHWPAGSTREIRQFAGSRILGRGGDGGEAIDYNDSVSSKSGKNGGTAIYAENDSPITVHNYDAIVAGGGGGGGASRSVIDLTFYMAEAGLVAPGSGGAPFGKAGTLAKNSASQPSVRMRYYVDGTQYRWQYAPNSNTWSRTVGDNTADNTTGFNTPQKIFDDSGLLVATPTFQLVAYEAQPTFFHQGGTGGGIGENGSAGTGTPDDASFDIGVPDGSGGLAGYIYQGPVTIVNHGSGQTKGRTP